MTELFLREFFLKSNFLLVFYRRDCWDTVKDLLSKGFEPHSQNFFTLHILRTATTTKPRVTAPETTNRVPAPPPLP